MTHQAGTLPADWQQQAHAHEARGDWDAARALYELAQLDPRVPNKFSLITQELRCAINVCDWSRHAYLQASLIDGIRNHQAIMVGETSLTLPALSLPDQTLCAQRWADSLWRHNAGARAEVLSARAMPTSRAPRRKLRIGFLGGDFYGQATTYLMIGIIEAHGRANLEYIAYNYGPARGDGPLAARARAAFDTFRDVGTLSNLDIARRIAADDLDMLLFLRGAGDARAGVLAMRPAPVQLAYLFYPGSFGFPLVDALIADSIVIPQALQHHYSERIIYLPRCYQPNDATRPLPQPIARQAVGLPDDAVVLANFAQSYKITPASFDIWCALLREHPQCVLWLLDTHPGVIRNLRREAALRNIDPARLHFAPRTETVAHLSRLSCADLILDTWPYGGHTGTSDALWAGVPVVARCGDTFASRVAPSLLHFVGLRELIANDDAQYHRIASELIGHAARRQALRDHLVQGRMRFALFDPSAYTRDFDALLERIGELGFQTATADAHA